MFLYVQDGQQTGCHGFPLAVQLLVHLGQVCTVGSGRTAVQSFVSSQLVLCENVLADYCPGLPESQRVAGPLRILLLESLGASQVVIGKVWHLGKQLAQWLGAG